MFAHEHTLALACALPTFQTPGDPRIQAEETAGLEDSRGRGRHNFPLSCRHPLPASSAFARPLSHVRHSPFAVRRPPYRASTHMLARALLPASTRRLASPRVRLAHPAFLRHVVPLTPISCVATLPISHLVPLTLSSHPSRAPHAPAATPSLAHAAMPSLAPGRASVWRPPPQLSPVPTTPPHRRFEPVRHPYRMRPSPFPPQSTSLASTPPSKAIRTYALPFRARKRTPLWPPDRPHTAAASPPSPSHTRTTSLALALTRPCALDPAVVTRCRTVAPPHSPSSPLFAFATTRRSDPPWAALTLPLRCRRAPSRHAPSVPPSPPSQTDAPRRRTPSCRYCTPRAAAVPRARPPVLPSCLADICPCHRHAPRRIPVAPRRAPVTTSPLPTLAPRPVAPVATPSRRATVASGAPRAAIMPPHGPATPSRAAAWCLRAALTRSRSPCRHSLPPAVAPSPPAVARAPSRLSPPPSPSRRPLRPLVAPFALSLPPSPSRRAVFELPSPHGPPATTRQVRLGTPRALATARQTAPLRRRLRFFAASYTFAHRCALSPACAPHLAPTRAVSRSRALAGAARAASRSPVRPVHPISAHPHDDIAMETTRE
ncbi:hypothetical protein DENSPDRAFT_886308 [Dentipellis sp. KUC8613]|nr:hypothetical protein DENSPDRAFT_886308 [Dentipellis sp. KUC8613]